MDYDSIPILDESHIGGPVIDGEQMSTGCIRRNYGTHPSGCMAFAQSFPDSFLLSDDECKARIEANIAAKADLISFRDAYYDILQSLNQDSLGLCWNFSSTKAIMYTLALQGILIKLSPWFNAGLIKHWQDQGGWGLESLSFAADNGVPRLDLCPEYKSRYDTPETRADAALRKVTEWWDGGEDREKNWRILKTCAALNIPTVSDYNWLSHSMCVPFVLPDLTGALADNSWGASAGEKGLYRLLGSKAKPDSIVIPRVGAFART